MCGGGAPKVKKQPDPKQEQIKNDTEASQESVRARKRRFQSTLLATGGAGDPSSFSTANPAAKSQFGA